jgi:S-(hydroxymethyl)glutathione dehydrogenase/alcohol dehydrogenase
MKTRAAVLWGVDQPFDVTEIELDPPKAGEILVKWAASGLCHSDYHYVTGDVAMPGPTVLGHEGAGIVEQVGPGVTRVKPGDHFVATFIPSCGHCRMCSTGHQNLCDVGQNLMDGRLLDGTYRFHAKGQDLGAYCKLGTFSQYSVVSEYSIVKIDESIPLEAACLIGCGVPTGWGSAVVAADVEPGDVVVVYGVGGVGMNAVQGASFAGARYVVAVDPVAFKREKALEFGASHVAASAEEARDIVFRLTDGAWADKAIITVGVMHEEVVDNAFRIIRKGGTLALTAIGPASDKAMHLSTNMMAGFQKRIQGVCAGNLNLQYDVLRLLALYQAGHLKLDELITKRYTLDEVNQGYKDLLDGKNIRGIIVH